MPGPTIARLESLPSGLAELEELARPENSNDERCLLIALVPPIDLVPPIQSCDDDEMTCDPRLILTPPLEAHPASWRRHERFEARAVVVALLAAEPVAAELPVV